MWVVGGGGMKEMVKRVIDKDPQTPVNIVYSPTDGLWHLIAIELR
jgi:ribose transport system substrate-binding protein